MKLFVPFPETPARAIGLGVELIVGSDLRRRNNFPDVFTTNPDTCQPRQNQDFLVE